MDLWTERIITTYLEKQQQTKCFVFHTAKFKVLAGLRRRRGEREKNEHPFKPLSQQHITHTTEYLLYIGAIYKRRPIYAQ
jgi:hypothetical protein